MSETPTVALSADYTELADGKAGLVSPDLAVSRSSWLADQLLRA